MTPEQIWTAFEEALNTDLGLDKDGNPQVAVNLLGSVKKNKKIFMEAVKNA